MRLLALLLLLLSLASCEEAAVEAAKEIRPVKYAKIDFSAQVESYTFSGVASAQNETNLSFKVGGTLSAVPVKLGAQVKKGQLIATIDPADYNIQTNQAVSQKEGAVANAKVAESQLVSSRSTYERVAQLYENNSVALSEYQQAKAALDAAQAQYDAANSQIKTTNEQLRAADNQVSYTRLVAPMNGVVTAVQVEANEVVNAGTLIAKVSSLGRPEIQVGVPEAVINKLTIGQAATVTFTALPGQTFEAEIAEIAFASGNATTYPVVLNIVNSEEKIRPGMATEVRFILGITEAETSNTIIAPLKAIASGTAGNYAFKLVPDEQKDGVYIVKKVAVSLGTITENGYTIKAGLSKGDLVAVAGLSSLYDKKKVTLLEE